MQFVAEATDVKQIHANTKPTELQKTVPQI